MAKTVDEGFQVMLSWLTPTATESEAARRHRESIRQCIQATFGLLAFFRTGSFGGATSVSGYSDVDYFAVLPREVLKNDSRISVLRLKAALDDRFPSTGIAVDWPAVKVPFGEDGDESTEVVVADYLGEVSNDVRIFDIPSPSYGWMKSSPEAHRLHVRRIDQNLYDELRPLIRLVKAWKYYCGARISSFYIELRAAEYAAAEKAVVFEIDLVGFLRYLRCLNLAPVDDPLGISSTPIQACPSERDRLEALAKLATGIQLAEAAYSASIRDQVARALALWDQFFCGRFPGYY